MGVISVAEADKEGFATDRTDVQCSHMSSTQPRGWSSLCRSHSDFPTNISRHNNNNDTCNNGHGRQTRVRLQLYSAVGSCAQSRRRRHRLRPMPTHDNQSHFGLAVWILESTCDCEPMISESGFFPSNTSQVVERCDANGLCASQPRRRAADCVAEHIELRSQSTNRQTVGNNNNNCYPPQQQPLPPCSSFGPDALPHLQCSRAIIGVEPPPPATCGLAPCRQQMLCP